MPSLRISLVLIPKPTPRVILQINCFQNGQWKIETDHHDYIFLIKGPFLC